MSPVCRGAELSKYLGGCDECIWLEAQMSKGCELSYTICPDRRIQYRIKCFSPIFTAALFIIGKTWKPPKCPSTEEWIKEMWYMYTMEY